MTAVEADGDYYVGPDGDPWAAPGVWLGDVARLLGLDGAVTGEALRAVMAGCDPRTGELLIRAGADGRHVAAHDCTFSAPSSVSAAWALANDELRRAIQAAHDEAVLAAFRHIERHAPVVYRRDREGSERAVEAFRRRHGRPPTAEEQRRLSAPRIKEPAAALLGAAFAHHTARRTHAKVAAGLPPDPQLHTHLLLCMAQRRDGRLVALDSRALFQHAAEAGAVYRAALAAALAQLGFGIERRTGGGSYFELRGVPGELREAWSSRHREVAAKVAEWRVTFRAAFGRNPTPAEERAWAAKTRAPKARWHRGELFTHWHQQASFLGVTPTMVARWRGGRSSLPPIEAGRLALMAELLSPAGITREHATFDLRALRLEAYVRAPGLLPASEVEPTLVRLLQRQDVVEVASGVWTTREMRQLEERVMEWHAARRTRGRPTGGGKDVWRAALARAPIHLSAEQLAAVTALGTGCGFTAVTGHAGVGKGVVLRIAADAWRAKGRRLFAVAVGGVQAQRLAADLGDGAQALTLDALTYRVRNGRLALGAADVIAVDEAGQIDTRRWAMLADTLGPDGPQVVALGDDAQLAPIGAGGLWTHLARGAVHLTEVRRTALEWERDAWAHVRRGESEQALALYARHHHLEIAETRAEALDRAVRAWDADGRAGVIITDASNAERYRANRAAQACRLDRGELGSESVEASTPAGPVELRRGDRVLFKGRYRALELQRRVENGTPAEVLAIHGDGGLRVRTGEAAPRELDVHPVWEGGWLDLGYAAHVASAQGTTVSRAYVVAGGWQTHRESFYVQLSRSVEGSRIFVDRETLGHAADADLLGELADRARESRAKTAAFTGHLPRRPRSRCSTRSHSDRPAWFVQAIAAPRPEQEAPAHGCR